MATRRAVANGNWSSTSTWNGGVVPTAGDTVYASSFTVTIDQNVNIGGANNPSVAQGSLVAGQWYQIATLGTTNWTSIGAPSGATVGTVFLKNATAATGSGGVATALATITTAADTNAGAAAGGGFTMTTAYTLDADIISGTTSCLTCSHSTGTASITNSRVVGGSASGAQGVAISGAGAVIFSTATFTSGTGGGGLSYAVNLSGSATITISSGALVSPTNGASVLANTSTTGILNVSNVTMSLTWSSGVVTTSSGNTTISSSTLNAGSNSTAYAASNTSTGILTITGSTITASSAAVGVLNSSTGTLSCSTCTFTAANGFNAVSSTNTSATNRFSGTFVSAPNGTQPIYAPKWFLNTAPTAAYFQAALDGINANSYVRFYTADNTGFGPATTDVRSGVSYGGGMVGTCAVPPAGSVSLGVPVGNTTGTAVLTQSDVQSALTAQGLTTARSGNLDNLDTTVSSRLAPSGTLATVTTLTNAPTVPSASAIASQVRTELGTELGRIDASVSSRLAGSAYTAPTTPPTAAAVATQVRTELTAELAKVSALNTTRLGQVATTEIVGGLLAQANS